MIRLGVNIDHVATIRQARGTTYPDPVDAALIAVKAGADGITLHLREDRRHIQDHDVFRLKKVLAQPINLEMAATEEMVDIALQVKPTYCCLVPEKRTELTTEGGLNVCQQIDSLTLICRTLAKANIAVSLFIDADQEQIDAAKQAEAPIIELHTGHYADATNEDEKKFYLARIQRAAYDAHTKKLIVNAGHGLTLENVGLIAAIPEIHELNIGHSIVARALTVGFFEAVAEMKKTMLVARGEIH